MGNADGMLQGFATQGTNEVIDFDGGYFSFAHGNEIALCLNRNFYILNCDSLLFDEVKKKVNSGASYDGLIAFWIEKSASYEISDWSNDFSGITSE